MPSATQYSKYIGHVGTLAVVLGIGGAITTPHIAWADDAPQSTRTSATTAGADTDPSPADTTKHRAPARDSSGAAGSLDSDDGGTTETQDSGSPVESETEPISVATPMTRSSGRTTRTQDTSRMPLT